MKRKTLEKKQPAGKPAIVLLVLIALVFMLMGPKTKASAPGTRVHHLANPTIIHPSTR